MLWTGHVPVQASATREVPGDQHMLLQGEQRHPRLCQHAAVRAEVTHSRGCQCWQHKGSVPTSLSSVYRASASVSSSHVDMASGKVVVFQATEKKMAFPCL